MEQNIIKIQKVFRGYIFRIKRMPFIMYDIQNYLKTQNLILSSKNEDGRINSCLDENIIIENLIKKYKDRIQKSKPRMWYDIKVKDYKHGWIPINIKTSTIKNYDNTGNLAMCVYSYTDYNLDLNSYYDNRKMSEVLIKKLKNKKYNKVNKKDYYFLVINKNNTRDIIINSVKGLNLITPNINNLPFQVNWSKNRNYEYEKINKKVKLLINCLKNPKPNWKEIFMSEIRKL